MEKISERNSKKIIFFLFLLTGLVLLGGIIIANNRSNSMKGLVSVPVTKPSVSLALAPDTPQSQEVTAGAVDINFLTFSIKNATKQAVKVTTLTVTKNGTAEDAAVEAIRLYDAQGAFLRSSTLVSGKGVFSGLNVVVKANSEARLSLTADISSEATQNTLGFSIASASDVIIKTGKKYNAGVKVSGTFPVSGNLMTITPSTIAGSLNIALGDNSAAAQVVVSDQSNVHFATFVLSSSVAEAVAISSLTFTMASDNAYNKAVKQITLENDQGESLTYFENMQSDNRVTFTDFSGFADNLIIEAHAQRKITLVGIMAQDAPATSIVFGIDHSTDVTAMANSKTVAVDGVFPVKGNIFTVKEHGSLTASLDSSTPPASSVPKGAKTVSFTVFAFSAADEDVEIRSIAAQLDGPSGTVTNVYLYDDVNNRLATAQVQPDNRILFDNFYYRIDEDTRRSATIKADISSSAANGEALVIGIHDADDVGALGLTSLKDILPSGNFPLNGNIITITDNVVQANYGLGFSLSASNTNQRVSNGTADVRFVCFDIFALNRDVTLASLMLTTSLEGNNDGSFSTNGSDNGLYAYEIASQIKLVEILNDGSAMPLGSMQMIKTDGKITFSNLNKTYKINSKNTLCVEGYVMKPYDDKDANVIGFGIEQDSDVDIVEDASVLGEYPLNVSTTLPPVAVTIF